MRRRILLAFLIAIPAVGQQPSEAQKPVAVINGEIITARKLDQLYKRLGTQMRDQYDKNGGKPAFLENYLRKRLVIQEAVKSGFDKRPDVQADVEAAKESTLFDRYIRDVVSASIVTNAGIREYYDKHPEEFATPERVHVRHIVVTAPNAGPQAKSKERALEIMKQIAAELHTENASVPNSDPAAAAQIRVSQFAQLARKYSEDASAQSGGDLGWVTREQLDPDFQAAAFALRTGMPSGIVETKFGYHLILVEAKQSPGIESFDEAKPKIREFLMTQHASDVMQAVSKLTNELRAKSKIAVYPENIK